MCEDEKRRERLRKFVEFRASDFSSYHDHKETMGHAAVVVQGALFVTAMQGDVWRLLCDYGVWGFGFFTTFWMLIHVYMRWQLRLRRFAAIQWDGIVRTLAWCATNEEIPQQALKHYEVEERGEPHGLNELADMLFPIFAGGLRWDHNAWGYPLRLTEELKAVHNPGNWNRLGEWIPTGASLLMFVGVVCRACWVQRLAMMLVVVVGIGLLFCLLEATRKWSSCTPSETTKDSRKTTDA